MYIFLDSRLALFYLLLSVSIYVLYILVIYMKLSDRSKTDNSIKVTEKLQENHSLLTNKLDGYVVDEEVFIDSNGVPAKLSDIIIDNYCMVFFHPDCKPCREEIDNLVKQELFVESKKKIILIPQLSFSLEDYPDYKRLQNYIYTPSQEIKDQLNPKGRIPYGVVVSKKGEIEYSGFTFTDDWRSRVSKL